MSFSSLPCSPDVGDYKNTSFAKELINQLLLIPKVEYFEHRTQMLLFRTLYYALSDHGKYYDHFLPDEKGWICYPRSWDDVNDASYGKSFYLDQIPKKTTGHSGHICASAIPAGKTVYNCYDCGVDATCCLCEYCFNKEEHSDHNVGVHRSSGDAICDCGDESSWKVKLKCKANEEEEKIKKKIKPLPMQFQKNISILIRVLFDFILDVNLKNLAPLPQFKFTNSDKNGDLVKSREDYVKELSKLDTLPKYNDALAKDMYKYKHVKNPPGYPENVTRLGNFMDYYCLVFWNDEFHNFEEANRFLSVAHRQSNDTMSDDHPFWEFDYRIYSDMEMEETGVERLAKIIDERGFVLYSRSKDRKVLEKQVNAFKAYERLGHNKLTYTIVTAEEYANIFLCRCIFVWMDYIFQNENVLFIDFFKQELSTVLFEKANFSVDTVSLFGQLSHAPFLLNEKLQIPIYKEYLTSGDTLYVPSNQVVTCIDKSLVPKANITYLNNCSRLQYLAFFEMRFPKEMRQNIKKLVLPTISNTKSTRYEFAKQMLTILPICETNAAFYDREWHLSMLETFRLQVYHDPNLGSQMLELGLFENVLDSLLYIMVHSKLLQKSKYYVAKTQTWKEIRTRRVFSQARDGLTVLFKFLHPGMDQIFNDNFMVKIFRVFSAFDKLETLKRKTGNHEEFQNERMCIAYYKSVLPIYSISQNFARICYGIKAKNDKVERSIALLETLVSESEFREYYDENVIEHELTHVGASMCHPVGDLLAQIVRSYRYYNPNIFDRFLRGITFHPDNSVSLNFKEKEGGRLLFKILESADEMLQPWVFHAQLSCNYWVRNGIYAEWAEKMFPSFNPENGIFFVQQALLTESFGIVNIARRYELNFELFEGSSFEESCYEERLPTILHEMMFFLYNVLTFRQYYDSKLSYEQIESLFNEYRIASMIAATPMRYSELQNLAPPGCDNFDEIVTKITKYLPPTDFNSYGQYTLKDEYWNKVDPFCYFHGDNSSSDIEEAVIKNLSTIQNKKETDVVVTPPLYPLNERDFAKFKGVGEYMRESDFVKVLYKVLRFAVTTENDYHLNMVLQLIHAIILDDEICNKGKPHGLKYFVEIPICNMLMSAAEKADIPKFVSAKASAVLELLLSKDNDVLTSLTDCFGAAHIEEYKKSIQNKSDAKSDKKKKNAQRRQRKILNKMKKQQNAFIDNNKTFLENPETKSETPEGSSSTTATNTVIEKPETEARNCIICKTAETTDAMFGIPAFISTSSDYWTIPTIDDCPPEFMVPGLPRIDESQARTEGKSSCCREKLVAYGCPHGMHYSCFKTMLQKKRMTINNFACPLCEGKFNMFVPSFKLGEIEIDAKSFENITFNTAKLYGSFNGNNVNSLAKQIFENDFNTVLSSKNAAYKLLVENTVSLNKSNDFLNKALPPFKVLLTSYYRNLRKGFYAQFAIPLLIASTLEMQEITNREDGSIAISEILNLVLKSFLQYRILTTHQNIGGAAERQQYFGYVLDNPYLGFMETAIVLFTETDFPLETCIKFSFMKRIVCTASAILQRYKIDPSNLNFDSILDKDISKPDAVSDAAYTKIFEDIGKAIPKVKSAITPVLIQKLHSVLKSNYKNYERQVKYMCLFFNTLPTEKSLLPELESTLANTLRKTNEQEFRDILIGGMAIAHHEKTYSKAHKRDENIDIIEYPQNIHLMKLPESLKDMALSASNKTEKIVYSTDTDDMLHLGLVKCSHVCLNCGTWLNKRSKHVKECKLSGYGTMFFSPMDNKLTLHVSKLITAEVFKVESPYLNKHGEPSQGVIGSGDAGTLGPGRYEHLEKIWFDQSIIRKYLREANEFFPSVRSASDAKNEAYIPGIFEPVSAKKGPDMAQMEQMNRLLHIQPTVFETVADARRMNSRSSNNPLSADDDDDDDNNNNIAMNRAAMREMGNVNLGNIDLGGPGGQLFEALQRAAEAGAFGAPGDANGIPAFFPNGFNLGGGPGNGGFVFNGPPVGFEGDADEEEDLEEGDVFDDDEDFENEDNFDQGNPPGFFQFMPQLGGQHGAGIRIDANNEIVVDNPGPAPNLDILRNLFEDFQANRAGNQGGDIDNNDEPAQPAQPVRETRPAPTPTISSHDLPEEDEEDDDYYHNDIDEEESGSGEEDEEDGDEDDYDSDDDDDDDDDEDDADGEFYDAENIAEDSYILNSPLPEHVGGLAEDSEDDQDWEDEEDGGNGQDWYDDNGYDGRHGNNDSDEDQEMW